LKDIVLYLTKRGKATAARSNGVVYKFVNKKIKNNFKLNRFKISLTADSPRRREQQGFISFPAQISGGGGGEEEGAQTNS